MSAASSKKGNSIGIKGKIKNIKSHKKVKYQQIYYFTIAIFFYGLCIMILTLIFLIIILKQNNLFKKIFDLFQLFRRMQRSIESISLSLFSNFCYYSGGNNFCVNYYKKYSYNLTHLIDSFQTVPLINDIIIKELNIRFEIANSIVTKFEKDIFRLNFKKINYIKQFKTQKYNILRSNDFVYVLREDILFIDLIREYINWITQILNNNDYLTEKFSLFNLEENQYNFEYLYIAGNNSYLNQFQKNMYFIVLNCPLIHKGLDSSSTIIQDEFQLALNNLNNYLLGFFLALLLLHIILYLICNIFLNFFLKVLKSKILQMNIRFEKKEYISFIKQRYYLLKNLCYLYQENPNNLVSNISRMNYKKKVKEDLNKAILESNDEKNHEKSINFPQLNDEHFKTLIKKYQLIITLSFLFYFVYAIVFYIFIDIGKKKLLWLVQYSIINQQLDSLTYDNSNSLIYLILSNSSRFDIGKRIYDKNNYDYLFEKMDELHQIIREKETMEEVHKDIFPPMNTLIDLNFINGKINEEVMNEVLNSLGSDLYSFFKVLCSHFIVATVGDDTMFIKNVLYLLNQMYNKYFMGSFEDVY